MNDWRLLAGDSREVLARLPENRFDSVVTDGPYELGFMGKGWDRSGIVFDPAFWSLVLRVMKPGSWLASFGGTRTAHRMACAIEDAGFEIRDDIHWFYGTGFPKSLGLEEGRGTGIKPGHEPIYLCRKPLDGTNVANLAKWGAGALNIDACRIGERWPANVALDEAAAAELDAQTAHLKRGGAIGADTAAAAAADTTRQVYASHTAPRGEWIPHGDSGGASRFFYVAKPTPAERDLGCDHLPAKSGGEATEREDGSAGVANPRAGAGRGGGRRNYHPTVKPITLMRYLVRLVTPVGGTVLDPFAGSGTTGIAARLESRTFVGIEREAEYLTIARARIEAAA